MPSFSRQSSPPIVKNNLAGDLSGAHFGPCNRQRNPNGKTRHPANQRGLQIVSLDLTLSLFVDRLTSRVNRTSLLAQDGFFFRFILRISFS
jgi:hypothetical protein